MALEDSRKNVLARIVSGTMAKRANGLTIGGLERELLKRFPREDAEEWDRMGLLVGDPSKPVTGVMVALDPTLEAIEAAAAAGANVLLTHHPVFLEPPAAFGPIHEKASVSGVNVYTAIELGVALMNFHTALDVSPDALVMLPGLLGLDYEGILVKTNDSGSQGYGQVCRAKSADAPSTLRQLAARCVSAFGRFPRVWGDQDGKIESVVIANGAAGNVVEEALRAHADCLVCGEVRYHAALDAAQQGLAIIELGHDVSELHLAGLLARSAVAAGVEADRVLAFDQSHNWTTPESTRV